MHSSATRPRLRVDVWSDLSCPWCWVGKKRMDKALSQVEEQGVAQVDVVFHAYIIDHGTSPQGEKYLDYNRRRWRGDGWTADLRRSGAPDGAAFANWRWWPSSVKAHQLLLLAQERGRGRQAKDMLLRLTYEEGQNISDLETLVQAAAQLGLDGEEARAHLEADAGRAAVMLDDSTGKRELGISGVPYFIVGLAEGSNPDQASGGPSRRYALSGAQPTSAFVRAINKVLGEQQNAS